MHARRGAVPQVRPVEVAPDALEVHPVPGLVDRTEKALVEEVAIHARGNADVARTERDAEWMRRDVLPPALEVVAELGDRVERVLELLVGIEATTQHAVVDRFRVSRDVGDQRHDGGLELVEDRLELVGRQPGLRAVQKSVVRTLLETESIGNSPIELDVLLEVGGEKLEVGLTAGPLPMGSGGGSRVGDLRDQLRWQLARLVV